MSDYKKIAFALLCGFMGCLCFGAGDWLMLYSDTTYSWCCGSGVYWCGFIFLQKNRKATKGAIV
ncbi:MAG: hypothetical protein LIO49_08285 [Ruminococcus sp.]|nr:hypothetical protein [Ruminococcus sp.]